VGADVYSVLYGDSGLKDRCLITGN